MFAFRQILQLPLIQNTLKLSSSSALMILLPVFVTPILSRLYTPEDYGDWGIFSSILYIVLSFVFLSYENAIIKTREPDEAKGLLAICSAIMLVITVFVGAVFYLGQFAGISFFVNFPCVPLLLLSIIMNGTYNLSSVYANSRKLYGSMAIANVSSGLAQASVRILLGVIPFVAYGLIVGNLLAQILGIVVLLFCFGKAVNIHSLANIRFKDLFIILKKYKKFPLFDAPARLIEYAIGNLTIIVLSFFWDRNEIGCFSMVTQFVLIPIAIVGSAMSNVYYKEIAENVNDQATVSSVTLKVAKMSSAMAFAPLLFLVFGGDQVLVLFLGDKWDNVGPMALCTCVFSVPVIMSEPLLAVYKTLDRQELRFRLNLVNFVLSLTAMTVSAYIFSNIYISLLLYAVCYAFIRYLMFFYELKLAKVNLFEISRFFLHINILCYTCLIVRLFFVFVK